MIEKECIILQHFETKDVVMFLHTFNEDDDEVYCYSNNKAIVNLNYDEYCSMIDYYESLHYDIIMKIQKA